MRSNVLKYRGTLELLMDTVGRRQYHRHELHQ